MNRENGMIGIGFIGAGGMGGYHARVFSKLRGSKVVAVADPSAEARERFAEHAGAATHYDDHRRLLRDKRVDAVVVAVPTGYHAKLAIETMRSGRHVMVEKPMARTVAEARRMNDVAEKTGRVLMVAQCRRYDTEWGTFGRLVNAGRLGRPILWRHVAAGMGPGGWFVDHKLSGGPIMDGAVHDQDYANFLFGDPQQVTARAIKLTGADCVDTVTAIVEYPEGDQLMLSWSWGVAPGGGTQDALGTKGSVNFYPTDTGASQADLKRYGYYRYANRKTGKSSLVRYTRKDMYQAQGRHFLDCIAGGAQCRTPGTEAIKAVAVAEAILAAVVKGGVKKVRW